MAYLVDKIGRTCGWIDNPKTYKKKEDRWNKLVAIDACTGFVLATLLVLSATFVSSPATHVGTFAALQYGGGFGVAALFTLDYLIPTIIRDRKKQQF